MSTFANYSKFPFCLTDIMTNFFSASPTHKPFNIKLFFSTCSPQQKFQLDRVHLQEVKRSSYEHTKKCADQLLLLGQVSTTLSWHLNLGSSGLMVTGLNMNLSHRAANEFKYSWRAKKIPPSLICPEYFGLLNLGRNLNPILYNAAFFTALLL